MVIKYSLNWMHCSIDVILNPSLKGLDAKIGKLPGLPSRSVLKIKQANNFLYVQYQQNQEMASSKSQLPSKLCELNNISAGAAQAEAISGVVVCKKATVYVKKLDWQIINQKSTRLEEQFLNQIGLVWPNAKIPLFYDRNNSVALRIQCDQLSFLAENSQLEILTDQADENGDGQEQEEELQVQPQNINRHFTEFGNINNIKVNPKSEFAKNYGNSSYRLRIIPAKERHLPADTTTLTVKEQLQLLKTNQIPENKKQITMPVQIQIDETIQEEKISICCLLESYFGIEDFSCVLIRGSKSKSQIVSKKIQFLLNSTKNFKIELTTARKQENFYSDGEVSSTFVQHFLNRRCQSLIVYEKIPFIVDGIEVGFVSFQQKQRQTIGDPIQIIFGNAEDVNLAPLKQKIYNSVKVNNCYYPYQITKKAAMLLKLSKNQSHAKVCSLVKPPEFFSQLYKTCYAAEISEMIKRLQAHSTKFILISSFSNNGKTILNSIIRQHGHQTLYLDMGQFDDTSLTLGDTTMFLQMCFQMWKNRIIFMDNLDMVCYKIDAGDLHRKQERIASKLIIRKILHFSKIYDKLCVVTAKNDGSLDEQFHSFHHIKLKNPNLEERREVLKQTNKYTEREVEQMAENSQSMSFGQFSKYAMTGEKGEQSGDQPARKNDFSKLAGIAGAKKLIRSMIFKPLRFSFVFKKLPVKLSRGVLLYGGSGTGKSAIGASLADQFQMKLFSVKGSDILSKYIGGSEAAVRQVFQKAMSVSPSIVFFDEFETIVPKRNSSNTGVTDRVVNQFLCYLDGVASIEGVFIVAASSRPELIDPALLRPGRIDSHIFLDYPEPEQRRQLFQLYKNSIKFQTNLDEVVNQTDSFSYSDMIGLIKELRIKRSAEVLKEEDDPSPQKFKFISSEFLNQTLKNYKISVSKAEQTRQRQIFKAFQRGDAPDISKQKTMLH